FSERGVDPCCACWDPGNQLVDVFAPLRWSSRRHSTATHSTATHSTAATETATAAESSAQATVRPTLGVALHCICDRRGDGFDALREGGVRHDAGSQLTPACREALHESGILAELIEPVVVAAAGELRFEAPSLGCGVGGRHAQVEVPKRASVDQLVSLLEEVAAAHVGVDMSAELGHDHEIYERIDV